MSIYLQDNSVVLDSGSVATSSDCCCNGVCCDCEGNCDDTVTQEDCESNGGQWFPADNCGDNPCDTLITGACCDGTDCSIKTQDCCEFGGGTYQGDDTGCEPNPCATCSCGFNAFDGSGRRFLTYTRVITGNFSVHSVSECPPPDGFNKTEIGNVSATFESHYNPHDFSCIEITDMDTSSSSRDGGLDSGDPCSRSDVGCFCPSVFPNNQCSGFLQQNYCQCGVSGGSCSTTDSATVRTTTCDLSGSCSAESTACSPPANYSCDTSGSYLVTETLSNECIPI